MSQCHACGRCSGHRNAVRLAARSPNREVLSLNDGEISRWEVMLLVYGVIGIALGAFQWSASPWFVALKQGVATWLVEHEGAVLLADNAPWWLLTHYPNANDVFTWLDGILILFYIGATALVIGSWILLWLRAAQALLRVPRLMWRLAYSLIPLAGVSVFLGLSMLTVTMLRAEGLVLLWVPLARTALLALGIGWSGWLAWQQLAAAGAGKARRVASWCAAMIGAASVVIAFSVQIFVW